MTTEHQTPSSESSSSDVEAVTASRFSDLDLHERLLKGLDTLGFETPTEVQVKTIPQAAAGTDLLVSAETGSGKTAAFALPILNRLLGKDAPRSATRALVLVPTRELARQVLQQFEDLGKFTFLNAGMIVGGEDYKLQIKMLRKNPEVLIATPGRLIEHHAGQGC